MSNCDGFDVRTLSFFNVEVRTIQGVRIDSKSTVDMVCERRKERHMHYVQYFNPTKRQQEWLTTSNGIMDSCRRIMHGKILF